MDEHREEFRVEPVRTRGLGRNVPIATFLVGVFLGAALFKPWDLLLPASRTATPSVTLAGGDASAGPTPTASPSGPPTECAFAGGWRVFALGQPDKLGGDGSISGSAETSDEPIAFADIANPLRRWLEIDPLTTASGPADRRVPFVTIVSDRIGGIGYCPPPSGLDRPPTGALFEAWSLDTEGAATVVRLRSVILDPATTIEIDVFIGADRTSGDPARWAPGRYVFAVEAPDRGGYGRWFGVEIRMPPGKEPKTN